MKNPFPGIDPYLESQGYWPDFRSTFINYWREAIGDALPDHYEARIDERVQIVDIAASEGRAILPDVSIVRQPGIEPAGPHYSTTAPLDAVTMDFPIMAEVRQTWIEILHRPDRELVAVLELLSPTNKSNPGRGQYLMKRNDLTIYPVHLIEVDLLLAGERLPMRQPLPPGDFYAIISRNEQKRKGQVFAWKLQDRLPIIPIPLLAPDPDIHVNPGAVFNTAYERGRFAKSIRYDKPLTLTLDSATTAWASERAKTLY